MFHIQKSGGTFGQYARPTCRPWRVKYIQTLPPPFEKQTLSERSSSLSSGQTPRGGLLLVFFLWLLGCLDWLGLTLKAGGTNPLPPQLRQAWFGERGGRRNAVACYYIIIVTVG